jgi:hypothetical protein
MMKRSLLYVLLLVAIFSCNKPEPKTDKLAEENISLMQDYAELRYKLSAKYYYDFQWDVNGRMIYMTSKSIYEMCDSLNNKLIELRNEPELKIIQEKSQKYFAELNKTALGDNQNEILNTIKPLGNASSSIDNNILKIWIFGTKCLDKLHQNLTANCGVVNSLSFESRVEKETYKLGDTVRIINYFEDLNKFNFNTQSLYLRSPTKIKSIQLNDSTIHLKNIISHFENDYIEIIPTQAGNYQITFIKNIERMKRKIQPHESSVEFTILP